MQKSHGQGQRQCACGLGCWEALDVKQRHDHVLLGQAFSFIIVIFLKSVGACVFFLLVKVWNKMPDMYESPLEEWAGWELPWVLLLPRAGSEGISSTPHFSGADPAEPLREAPAFQKCTVLCPRNHRGLLETLENERYGNADTTATCISFLLWFLCLRRHVRNPVTFDGINKSDTMLTEFYWNVNRHLK